MKYSVITFDAVGIALYGLGMATISFPLTNRSEKLWINAPASSEPNSWAMFPLPNLNWLYRAGAKFISVLLLILCFEKDAIINRLLALKFFGVDAVTTLINR